MTDQILTTKPQRAAAPTSAEARGEEQRARGGSGDAAQGSVLHAPRFYFPDEPVDSGAGGGGGSKGGALAVPGA